MINDNFALTGALTVAVNDVVVQEVHNLVVAAGKEWVADRMADANTVMTHMAIGAGTVPAAAGDTALGNESSRNTLTTSGGVVTANVIEYACTWVPGVGTGAITEAGILDAGTAGDMLARTVFPVVNKGVADSMTITWSITVS